MELYVAIVNITNYATLVITTFNLLGDFRPVARSRFRAVCGCSTIIIPGSNKDTSGLSFLASALSGGDGIGRSVLISRRRYAMARNDGIGSDSAGLIMPRGPRGFSRVISLRAEGNGRRLGLSSDKMVLDRGVYDRLKVGANSGVVLGISNGGTRIGIDKVFRRCLCGFICVAPATCGDLFNDSYACGVTSITLGSTSSSTYSRFNSRILSSSGVTTMDCVTSDLGRFQGVLGSLSLIIAIVVVYTTTLTFIMLCGLAGVGVTRHIHRVTAFGILKFCGHRASSFVCGRGVVLALLKVVMNLFLKGLLANFVVRAIRISGIVFKESVCFASCLCTTKLAFLFSVLMGTIVDFGVGTIGVIRDLGDIRWQGVLPCTWGVFYGVLVRCDGYIVVRGGELGG